MYCCGLGITKNTQEVVRALLYYNVKHLFPQGFIQRGGSPEIFPTQKKLSPPADIFF